MATIVPSLADHTRAVVTLLRSSGHLVGEGEKPPGGGWQGTPGQSSFVPYMIVDPIPGGVTSGPAGEANADASFPWDVRCVAASQYVAEQLADIAVALICTGVGPQVPGRRLTQTPSLEMRGPARPDQSMGDGQTLFLASPRFRIYTSPDPQETP